MTVTNTQTSTGAMAGNGATTVWPYAFVIPDAASAVVTVVDQTVTPATTTVLVASQYTISGLGAAAGGTVTYPTSGAPLTAGQYITIARSAALTQPTALANQGPYLPAAVEAALDRIVLELQQLATSQRFALQVSQADPGGAPSTLPIASARANLLLGFDAAGNPLATATGVTGLLASVLGAKLVQGNPFLVQPKGGNYLVVAADDATVINCTATLTLSFTATATLGNGFGVYVKNSSTGRVTIDPNAAELVDGQATIILEKGEGHWIASDGTQLLSIGRSYGLVELQAGTLAAASSLIITGIDNTYPRHLLKIDGLQPGTNNVGMSLQISEDNGGSWIGTANYGWTVLGSTDAAATIVAGNTTGGSAALIGANLSNLGQLSGDIELALFGAATIGANHNLKYDMFHAPQGAAVARWSGAARWYGDANAINAIRVIPGSGTINVSKYTFFGYRSP